MRLRGGRSAVQAGVAFEVAGVPGARIKLAGVLARGVVSQEPADRFGGGGKMPGVLPRLEQLGGRRECGDLAAGLGRVVLIDSGQDEEGTWVETWSIAISQYGRCGACSVT